MPRQALDLDQARDVGGLVLRQGMPDHQVSTAAIVASRRRAGSEEARADQEPRASRRASRAVRCRVFCHSSRTTICRTHSFEIPTASPIALSVAPAFRALAIALSRPTPRAISCCNLGITVLSRRVRSFVRAAALARASFSWRMYEGYVSVAPLRRCNRPSTAPRLVPSFSAIFAAERPSASSRRSRSSRSGVQKLPDIRRIFLMRHPFPSAPILAIPAAHATTKHLTSNHHDNDGSTPPFHRTAGQRLPVSVRRTPPWAAPRQQTLAGILRRAPSCQERL
jgi:hypothetical protein